MKEIPIMGASRKYGKHPGWLGVLLRMGAVEGRKDADGHWLIRTASLEEYLRKPRRGRQATTEDHQDGNLQQTVSA